MEHFYKYFQKCMNWHKVFKYATVSVLLDTTLTQANMENKIGMVYDRDFWDTTSDYYNTLTGKIETKIDQQLLQVSNDDFLLSEVQYFESNGQQVAENQNTDSIIRAKIGFVYRAESEVLTATQEERAKTSLLSHLTGKWLKKLRKTVPRTAWDGPSIGGFIKNTLLVF